MTIREHLGAIYEQHGKLTPDLVVETARPKNHPLHAAVFDKTTAQAASAYYLSRAQDLIRSCRMSYVTPEGGVRDMRAFYATRSQGPEEFVYRPTEEIAEDPVASQILLRDMEREWRQMLERYGRFKEFVEMVRGSLDEAA